MDLGAMAYGNGFWRLLGVQGLFPDYLISDIFT